MNSRDKRTAKRSRTKADPGGCLVLIIIGLLVWFLGPWDGPEDKQIQALEKLTQAQDAQIETLKKSQRALENLVNFIQREKTNAEIRSGQLKSDIERLRDLQKVDQGIVDKIFEEQQKQQEKEKWIERLASFLIGIFSTIAFELSRSFIKRLRTKNITD